MLLGLRMMDDIIEADSDLRALCCRRGHTLSCMQPHYQLQVSAEQQPLRVPSAAALRPDDLQLQGAEGSHHAVQVQGHLQPSAEQQRAELEAEVQRLEAELRGSRTLAAKLQQQLEAAQVLTSEMEEQVSRTASWVWS